MGNQLESETFGKKKELTLSNSTLHITKWLSDSYTWVCFKSKHEVFPVVTNKLDDYSKPHVDRNINDKKQWTQIYPTTCRKFMGRIPFL